MDLDPRRPRPPYDVLAVFDPDGELPDFAYTTGVFDAYTLPELFVWATPDEGVDPGETWVLSPRDQHATLGEAVERGRAQGNLELGDTWDNDLDGGRAVLRVPVVAAEDDLETCALPVGTPLRRLHLTLVRPPIGVAAPLTPEASHALVRRTLAWAEALAIPCPPVDTSLEQVYGPCTSGVDLLLEAISSLEEDDLWTLAAIEGCNEDGTRDAAAGVDAVARTAGRGPWSAMARRHVDEVLSEVLCLHPERELVERPIGTALRVAVGAWLVADLVDAQVFRAATASVRCWISRAGIPEDEQPIPAAQVELVRRLLSDLPGWPHDDLDRDHLVAAWWLACSGRGSALVDLCVEADAVAATDDRVWLLLTAAAVSDLRPDLLSLLPPGHRLAS